MTLDEFMAAGRLNSRLSSYRRKKIKAIGVCREQLQSHSAPYISISGGKDSVAMAFLVKEAAGNEDFGIRLWIHISDASFPGTIECARTVSEMTGFPLDVYESKESAFRPESQRERQKFGKSGVFFDSIRAYAKDKDLAFVGVRAAESNRRRQAAKVHGMVFHSDSMGDCDVVNPLQWFSIYDVFSVLWEYDAPIHPIYRKFAINTKLANRNKEPQFIRLGYVTAKDLMDKGTVVFLKANYPELYSKLVAAYPAAQNFT